MYKIKIAPSAERDLKKNTKLSGLDDIVNAIDNLSLDPRPIGMRKVKGFRNTFRIRVHSYRIIYDIYKKEN